MASNSNHTGSSGPRSRATKTHQSKSTAIFWSVVGAVIVFGGFVGYAYLAPATFTTSAVVKLEAPPELLEDLPEPQQAADKLRAAVMEPETFKEVARLSGSENAPAQLQLANKLKAGLEVTPRDRQTFVFSYADADAERAQKACNVVARRAAQLAPRALLKSKTPEPSARSKKLEELLAFLKRHPGMNSQAVQAEAASPELPAIKEDPLLQALDAERRTTLAELEKLKQIDPENPYADGVDAEIKTLVMRLREIDAGIASRKQGLAASANGASEAEVAPDLADKWVSLLDELSRAPAAKTAATRLVGKGVVVSEADFPRWPVDPDRQLLLLIGSLVALVIAALGVTFALVPAKRRPSHSGASTSEPPEPAQAPAVAPEAAGVPGAAPQFAEVSGVPEAPRYNAQPGGFVEPGQAVDASHPLQGTDAMRSPEQGRIVGAVPVRVTSEPKQANPALGADKLQGSDSDAADEDMPRTALGGFGRQTTSKQGATSGASAAMPRPISVRGSEVPVAEPAAERSESQGSIEAAGVEVVAATDAAMGAQEDDTAGARYRAPARKKTQMLGSPTWATAGGTNASDGQAPPHVGAGSPADNRYSYVSASSTEQGADPGLHPARSQAADGSRALARYQQRTPLVATQPPAHGWVFDASLVNDGALRLCQMLTQEPRQGCLVVGVAGFAELSTHKSRLAAGIAAALSHGAQHRVLLLEGDFQAPLTHRSVAVEMPIAAGLSQQLQMRRIRDHQQEPPWLVVECGATLHVMGEGVIRSPGAILSREYEQCLKELQSSYDYIIVDGPALTSEVECRALAQLIHGVVLVAPRADTQLPPEVTSVFYNKQFSITYGCLG